NLQREPDASDVPMRSHAHRARPDECRPRREPRPTAGRESSRGSMGPFSYEEIAMSFLENLRRKGRNRPVGRSARRPLMEDLEPRVVMSSNGFSGGTGADVFLLRRDPNNAAALEVKITQGTKTTTDVSLAVVAGDTITLNGLGDNDTFNIENTFFNVPLPVTVGPATHPVHNTRPPIYSCNLTP